MAEKVQIVRYKREWVDRVVVGARIPASLFLRLRESARRQHITRSDIVREALTKYLGG